jgi:hypothetical protein
MRDTRRYLDGGNVDVDGAATAAHDNFARDFVSRLPRITLPVEPFDGCGPRRMRLPPALCSPPTGVVEESHRERVAFLRRAMARCIRLVASEREGGLISRDRRTSSGHRVSRHVV